MDLENEENRGLDEALGKLQGSKNESDIEKWLQTIGKILIEDYKLRAVDGSFELIPLWIEAYYVSKSFKDPNVDAFDADGQNFLKAGSNQVDRLGELYFARMSQVEGAKNYRGRVDIVLSNSPDSALSFLIKGATIKNDKGEWIYYSQSKVANELCRFKDKSGKTSDRIRLARSENKKLLGGEIETTHRVSPVIETLIKDGKNKKKEEKFKFMEKKDLGVFRKPSEKLKSLRKKDKEAGC